jgi:hypothetical protein
LESDLYPASGAGRAKSSLERVCRPHREPAHFDVPKLKDLPDGLRQLLEKGKEL